MSLWFRNGGKSVLSELGLSPAEFRAADLEPALCAALGTPVVAEIKASGSHRDGGSYQSGIVAGVEFRDGAYRIWLAVARG